MVKKWGSISLTALLAATVLTPSVSAEEHSFPDVEADYWAAEKIQQAVEKGVIEGFGDGTFRPTDSITRGAGAGILVRALDSSADEGFKPSFTDISENDEWFDEAAAAEAEGWITGLPDGSFAPDASLTRAQVAELLTDAFALETENPSSSNFQDVGEDHWAHESIDTLVSLGLATGYENGEEFRPNQEVTRAEFTTFLVRALSEGPGEKEPEYDEAQADELREISDQLLELESYTFTGDMTIDMTMPLLEEDVEMDIEDTISLEADLRGSYQYDPLITETITNTSMPDPAMESMKDVGIVTEDAVYSKIQNPEGIPEDTPGLFPEEWEGQFLETPLAPEGYNGDLFDITQQQELMHAFYNELFEVRGTEFFEITEASHDAIPEGIDHERVVSVSLDQTDLELLFEQLGNIEIPGFDEALQSPEIMSAAISAAGEETDVPEGDIDIDDIFELIDFETLEWHQAIDSDGNVTYDSGELALSIQEAGETVSMDMTYALDMDDFNEEISFEYGVPAEEDIISEEEYLDWLDEQMNEEYQELPEFEEELEVEE
ncbi:S-layer homology domain-containing protein [Salsuginibacillus kocurii]|uniref:S-layer homology domain-containing protein n=1 Tax=Salsuginibacillus kocurii TaxID=427078 RepID=UPI00036FFEB3|nr:S-layer homology domain-containing protein [Salsuginibacillus kocurii]